MSLKVEDLAKPETLLVSLLLMAGSYVILPVLGGILRPVAKTAIKGGMMATDWVQTTAAEATRKARDMMDEARPETAPEPGPSRKPEHKPTATTP
jgi:hypothetical protein